MANYALGLKPIPKVKDGHEFVGDNFLQLAPTKILEGVKGLRFKCCNLTNCILPEDAVTDSCRPKFASFCSHNHPHFVQHGLAECAEDCEHVIDSDEIKIDGMPVDKVYHYSDMRADKDGNILR